MALPRHKTCSRVRSCLKKKILIYQQIWGHFYILDLVGTKHTDSVLLPQPECIRDRYKTQKCGAVCSCLCHFLLPQPECVSRSWLWTDTKHKNIAEHVLFYVHVSNAFTTKRVYLDPGLGEAERIEMWRSTFFVYVHVSKHITAKRPWLGRGRKHKNVALYVLCLCSL